jgi:hypothetical protein
VKKLSVDEIRDYVNKNIVIFHANRINRLKKLKLDNVLARKNPYLFKAKNILKAQELVETLLEAYLSSQEETIFGEFLEGLAVYICSKSYNGRKSSAEGIDLEFEKDDVRYIVSIKSGPNWGNSEQIRKMRDSFKKAIKIIRTNNSKINIVPVNGCCYGRQNIDKGDYLKICGQKFWEFISGDSNLYIDIVDPLGYKAKSKNQTFKKEYSKLVNLFTLEFLNKYCDEGEIRWDKLVIFNSGINRP